jgi:hypothetical protein
MCIIPMPLIWGFAPLSDVLKEYSFNGYQHLQPRFASAAGSSLGGLRGILKVAHVSQIVFSKFTYCILLDYTFIGDQTSRP